MIPVFVTMAIYYGQSIQRGAPLEWQRFTAIAIFLVAAVSDGLDGYIARRYKQRSTLGAILDPIADKGLLLSAIITLSIRHRPRVRKVSSLVSRSRYHARCRHSRRRGCAALAQWQSTGETKLDRQSCHCLTNGGDCVGDVAASFSFPALRRDRRRRVHVYLRNHLRDGWGAAVASRGARTRKSRLSSVVLAR